MVSPFDGVSSRVFSPWYGDYVHLLKLIAEQSKAVAELREQLRVYHGEPKPEVTPTYLYKLMHGDIMQDIPTTTSEIAHKNNAKIVYTFWQDVSKTMRQEWHLVVWNFDSETLVFRVKGDTQHGYGG